MSRQVAVKGKPFSFKVGPKKTTINGPSQFIKKGSISVENEIIAKGPVTPGKVQNYIMKEILR